MVELQPSKLITWVRFPSSAPDDISVRTFIVSNLTYNQSVWVDFFVCKKIKNDTVEKKMFKN